MADFAFPRVALEIELSERPHGSGGPLFAITVTDDAMVIATGLPRGLSVCYARQRDYTRLGAGPWSVVVAAKIAPVPEAAFDPTDNRLSWSMP